MTNTQEFYDGFADMYRFIFANWEKSVERQSEIISTFLETQAYTPPATILDCTCGIGTQAIGLATKGYHVHGTDLSPKSIDRAKEYARQFETDYPLTFDVADLLQKPSNPVEYDVVLAFDNPIAHFLTDDALRSAFQTMASQAKKGGLITTSLRDYDEMLLEKPRQSHISVTDNNSTRRIMFQVWDWWENGQGYNSEMFIITRNSEGLNTESHQSQSRAWQRSDISRILAEAGFSEVEWHLPEQSGFYQPIVTARK